MMRWTIKSGDGIRFRYRDQVHMVRVEHSVSWDGAVRRDFAGSNGFASEGHWECHFSDDVIVVVVALPGNGSRIPVAVYTPMSVEAVRVQGGQDE